MNEDLLDYRAWLIWFFAFILVVCIQKIRERISEKKLKKLSGNNFHLINVEVKKKEAHEIARDICGVPWKYFENRPDIFISMDLWETDSLSFWEQVAYLKCNRGLTLVEVDVRLAENVQDMLRKQYDELSDEEKKILDDSNHGDGFSYVMQTFNYRLREIYMSDRVQAFKKYEEEMWK